MTVAIFILKMVAITYFIDAWLYWLHVAFHSKRSPVWFRRLHMQHHADFQRSEVFSLHPAELFLDSIVPFFFTSWLMGNYWFFPCVVLPWGVFEAARGHGHFKWFKIIPRGYYKALNFCGTKYHGRHHAPGGENINLGQMLRTWDNIMGTYERQNPICAVSKR